LLLIYITIIMFIIGDPFDIPSKKKIYKLASQYKLDNDFNNYLIYLTASADLNYPPAQECLLDEYLKYTHLKQDHSVTIHFYQNNKNRSYCCNYLGMIAYSEEKLSIALNMYRDAIIEGNSLAMVNLGIMYQNGEGIDQCHDTAVNLYKMSLKGGCDLAAVHLGHMYMEGLGVKKNYHMAKTLFEIAKIPDWETYKPHKMVTMLATTNLGYIYDEGLGVRQNYEHAAKLYLWSVNQGHDVAMNNLGILYHEGNGIKQNYQKAADLYKRAIELGNSAAERNLAALEKSLNK